MYHPTTRLLTILELLQSYGEMSGTELASRLEVDARTIRRYVSMLQDMAIPIESERGRHGCYRLRPGYKLPPLMFSPEEAVAVTLGLIMTRRLGLGVDPVNVNGAIAKMERVLPSELTQSVQAIEDALVVETPLPDTAPNSAAVVALSLAVQKKCRVHMVHGSLQGKQTKRLVDPYGVLYRNGYWYTAGYCHLRQALRSFRLDRVLDVQLTEDDFEKPPDFDLLAFVEESIAQTPGLWHVDVLLDTTLAEAKQIIPRALAVPIQEEGGVAIRCYVKDLNWFAYFLAGLNCPLRVREPDEVRAALVSLAHKITDMIEQPDKVC